MQPAYTTTGGVEKPHRYRPGTAAPFLDSWYEIPVRALGGLVASAASVYS